MLQPTISSVVGFLIQWEVILFLFIFETLIRFLSHPKEAFEQIPACEKDEIITRANELHSRALTLVALVVAGVSIILSQEPNRGTPTPGLTLLSVSVAFLMVSHQSKNLVRGRRFWSQVQERTMEYGALSLFAGLILLYRFYSDADVATTLLQVAFVFVLLIRLNAVQKLTRSEFRKWDKQEDTSRARWTTTQSVGWVKSKISR